MPEDASATPQSVSPTPPFAGNGAQFEYWAKCEDIAMHFNELTIRFRLQALGGVAVVGAVLGYAKKTQVLSRDAVHYGIAVVLCFWASAAMIDFLYYGRLLKGAVKELLRIEGVSAGALRLSTAIDEACRDRERPRICPQLLWRLMEGTGLTHRAARGRLWFYALPAIGLAAVLFR